MKLNISTEVANALSEGRPVVALESTVIAHGLPYPQNLETANKLEQTVREAGAVPATIAVFSGDASVGLSGAQIEQLATARDIRKISRRDLPIATAKRLNCATTVATTAFLAHRAGISVFATGGIGGVHRGELPDISADLTELAQTPIAVVCSGAKIVLDLPSTREWLETYGVTVVGYRTTEFPAFYSRTSGLPVDETVDNAIEAAEIISARDQLGLPNAILIGVPIPQEFEIERKLLETLLADALHAGSEKGIRGKEVTPFLLSELSARSGGTTLQANIALLENNARIAAEIACALAANR